MQRFDRASLGLSELKVRHPTPLSHPPKGGPVLSPLVRGEVFNCFIIIGEIIPPLA